MSDELQQLTALVGDLGQQQQRHQRRIGNLENAFQIVQDILLRQDETNDFLRANLAEMRAESAERRSDHANLEVKFNALVDAQIRTEDAFRALADRQLRTEERQSRTEEQLALLVDAQIRTEDRFRALAERQLHTEERQLRADEQLALFAERQSRTEERQSRTDEQLALSAERQSRTDEQLALSAERQSRTDEQLNLLAAEIRTGLVSLSNTVNTLATTVARSAERRKDGAE